MPFDGIYRGRARTHDAGYALATYGGAALPTHDGGHQFAPRMGQRFRAHDGQWHDSAGAFLLAELGRLDQTLHMPLASISWGRDINLREDVTIADEVSLWTQSTFGQQGGLGAYPSGTRTGKAWIGKNTNQIAGVGLDIAMLSRPLRPWALEIKYTVFELESALKLGRPVDQQKFEGLKMKHQLDIDCQVYAGDAETGDPGLVNMPLQAPGTPGVGTITNLPVGAQSGNQSFLAKLPSEILADFNFALNTVWAASAWAVVPERVLLPPAQYGYLATELVSTAGTTSILRYIEENNLLTRSGRGRLEILPLKWCNGAGAGGTIGTAGPGTSDRMVVYTRRPELVRYPMTILSRTPIQYDGVWQKCTYFAKLGVIESVYGETLGYFDRV